MSGETQDPSRQEPTQAGGRPLVETPLKHFLPSSAPSQGAPSLTSGHLCGGKEAVKGAPKGEDWEQAFHAEREEQRGEFRRRIK